MSYNKPPVQRPPSKPHPKPPQLVTIGNSIEINIDPFSCPAEIRADVTVAQFAAVRLWGQVVNCNNEPVANALVKLVRLLGTGECEDYASIAHTTSNCQGFYQFDICSDEAAWYKVLVGKSTTGKEIIVSSHTAHHHPMPDPPPYPMPPHYSPGYEMDCDNPCPNC
ncbi:MAG: hypothetical protein ACRDDX_03160 [Cellulosilyticaceae bacterium]